MAGPSGSLCLGFPDDDDNDNVEDDEDHDEDVWQQISRCVDEVARVVSNGMGLLNHFESDKIRITDLGKEIIRWRAVLRHSNFLRVESTEPIGWNGNRLDNSMTDIITSMKEKRLLYFEKAKTIPLENIRYENLKCVSNQVVDEIDIDESYLTFE